MIFQSMIKRILFPVAAVLLLAGCANFQANLRTILEPRPRRKELPPPQAPPELVSVSRSDYHAMVAAVRAQREAEGAAITFVSRKPDGSVDVWTTQRFWYRPEIKRKYTVRKVQGGWQVISVKPWF
jgi:hypothetical protein